VNEPYLSSSGNSRVEFTGKFVHYLVFVPIINPRDWPSWPPVIPSALGSV